MKKPRLRKLSNLLGDITKKRQPGLKILWSVTNKSFFSVLPLQNCLSIHGPLFFPVNFRLNLSNFTNSLLEFYFQCKIFKG